MVRAIDPVIEIGFYVIHRKFLSSWHRMQNFLSPGIFISISASEPLV